MGIKKHYVLHTRNRKYTGKAIFTYLMQLLVDTPIPFEDFRNVRMLTDNKGYKTQTRIAWDACKRFGLIAGLNQMVLQEFPFRTARNMAQKHQHFLRAVRDAVRN